MSPQPPRLPPEIYLTFAGKIDSAALDRIFGAFNLAVNHSVKRVHFLIQSGGGSVEDGLAAYNYLTHLPLELVTYNEGTVASIAVLLYLAGPLRKCAGNASFFIHKTTFTFEAPVDTDALALRAAIVKNSDEKTEVILRQHFTIPDDKLAIRDKTGLVINAQEAKQFGLVHEIEHFSPPAGSNHIFKI